MHIIHVNPAKVQAMKLKTLWKLLKMILKLKILNFAAKKTLNNSKKKVAALSKKVVAMDSHS